MADPTIDLTHEKNPIFKAEEILVYSDRVEAKEMGCSYYTVLTVKGPTKPGIAELRQALAEELEKGKGE